MSGKSYNAGENDKVIHDQSDKTGGPRGTTHQQDVYVSERGSSEKMHIWHERSDSTGRVREGGHGEKWKKDDGPSNSSSSSNSESSSSGK